ncbi:MAG TPA: TatD family hydrolase [Methylophilaceae bacterium]|nr:TatD family hydrolase [Methylophilaceae bacterium]
MGVFAHPHPGPPLEREGVHQFIDTHCHLDAREFDVDRDGVALAALDSGVSVIVVPAVERANFERVCSLAEQHQHCAIALGIHPMYVDNAQPEDLSFLAELVAQKQPVAIGEIGLDFFVEGFNRERQEYYFVEQLKLARQFDLPVILHVRRAVDDILKHLRRIKIKGGIAHAFNGSKQQAEEFIKLGFKLGFGGAMTYPRALKIRELAATLPLEAIVLETDAPDIPPEWLGLQGKMDSQGRNSRRNSPDQLPKIAQVLADLRGLKLMQVAEITTQNAFNVLPKLADLYTPAHVPH